MAKSKELFAYVLSWGLLLLCLFIPCGQLIAIFGVCYLFFYRWLYKKKKPYFETFKGVF